MPEEGRRELTLLVVSATVLGVLDSMVPRPVPFMRLGLANIPSVIALVRFGWIRTLELNVFRAFIVALVMGTAATPTFILSLSGAAAAASAMGVIRRVLGERVSIPGISVAGAVSSLWSQLLVAGVILHDIPVEGIVPLLSGWGVISGVLVGVLAKRLDGLFTRVSGIAQNRVLD